MRPVAEGHRLLAEARITVKPELQAVISPRPNTPSAGAITSGNTSPLKEPPRAVGQGRWFVLAEEERRPDEREDQFSLCVLTLTRGPAPQHSPDGGTSDVT